MFLGYAGRHGQSLIDRALYLPADYANDERRHEARIPADIAFATKLKLGLVMLARAPDRHPVCWINGDSVYGPTIGSGAAWICTNRADQHTG